MTSLWILNVQWPQEDTVEEHPLPNVYDEFTADTTGMKITQNEGVKACIMELNDQDVCIQAFGYENGVRTFYANKPVALTERELN